VVGEGRAHWVRLKAKPSKLRPGTPAEVPATEVYSVDRNGRFDVRKWRGSGGSAGALTVAAGKVQ